MYGVKYARTQVFLTHLTPFKNKIYGFVLAGKLGSGKTRILTYFTPWNRLKNSNEISKLNRNLIENPGKLSEKLLENGI